MSYIHWLRSHVGSQKIFLVFATVIVTDGAGRVLLQRRTDFAWWGLPGGALELGEDIEACARRELREETGLAVGVLALVGVYSEPEFDVAYPNGDVVQQYTICLAGRTNGGQLQADGVETTGATWFALDQLPDNIPVWYRAMLADYGSGKMPAFRPPSTTPPVRDQVRAIRQAIGTAPFIGAGASGLVWDQGRLLIIRRQDSGRWQWIGGFSDLGENVAQTIEREVAEETGIVARVERLLGVSSQRQVTYPNGDVVQIVTTFFRLRPIGGQLRPDGTETLEARWCHPREIPLLPLHSDWTHWERLLACLKEGAFIA